MKYQLKVFISGMPGYFSYEIGDNMEQAFDHLTNVVRDGYRRVDDRQQMVHYMPRVLEKVILTGPGIETKYPDKIVTT
jgi:hypothetical protein